jgi:hypothetical protein
MRTRGDVLILDHDFQFRHAIAGALRHARWAVAAGHVVALGLPWSFAFTVAPAPGADPYGCERFLA